MELRSRPSPPLRRPVRALALAAATVVVGVLAGCAGPAPSVGPSPSPVARTSAPRSAATCDASVPTVQGSWWSEVGGPHAFFNWDSGAQPADWNPRLIFVRFDPDAGTGEPVSVWADRADAGDHQPGYLDGRQDPHLIARLGSPAPILPGGWYLFEQRLPSAGCWQLSAAVGDRLVGTALVKVGPPAQPTPEPSASPAPTPRLPPPDPMPTMPAETPGLGPERTANDAVELYTQCLRFGCYETSWTLLAPEARAHWGSLEAFTKDRTAYFKTIDASRYVVRVWPTDIAPITAWLSDTYGAPIDLRHAVLVKVDYPALSSEETGYDIYIVRTGENGVGEIFDVR